MRKDLFGIATGMLLAAVAILHSGCKEDTIIKSSVAPGDNSLNAEVFPDNSLNIITKSRYVDTLLTSNRVEGIRIIQALGTVNDPYFGRTNTGLYFQVLPTSNDFDFSAESYTLDSAFMIIPYTGYMWGDTSQRGTQRFTVYEITDSIGINGTYYSNQRLNLSQPISNATTVDLQDVATTTPTVNGIERAKHMRIKLNQTFLDKVGANVRTSTFTTKADFLNTFKGFCVQPSDTTQNGKVLTYCYLDGAEDYSRASILFYFHETTGGAGDTTQTAFFNFVREDCANFNWITRNYSTVSSPVKSILDNYSNTVNTSDSILVMQNLPGAAIDIRITNINDIPFGVINKAELVITKVSTGNTMADSAYVGPNRLDPVVVESDGTIRVTADREISGGSAATTIGFIDGNAKTTTINGQTVTQYRINIPREVQKAIIEKRNELHLRIQGALGFPAAYRLVAAGRNNGAYKVQMNITYTKPQ